MQHKLQKHINDNKLNIQQTNNTSKQPRNHKYKTTKYEHIQQLNSKPQKGNKTIQNKEIRTKAQYTKQMQTVQIHKLQTNYNTNARQYKHIEQVQTKTIQTHNYNNTYKQATNK